MVLYYVWLIVAFIIAAYSIYNIDRIVEDQTIRSIGRQRLFCLIGIISVFWFVVLPFCTAIYIAKK
jgi:hypothetical protein